MSSLFGNGGNLGPAGSEQSNTHNQAFPFLQGALGGNVGHVAGAGNQIADMLGLNGDQSQNQGFSNWRNSTGYKFGLNQGLDAINGSAATQGLLNSGGNEKAIMTYGQNYADTKYGDYINQLQGLLGSGNQSAAILGNAGTVSNSSKAGQSGLGQLLDKGASMAMGGM